MISRTILSAEHAELAGMAGELSALVQAGRPDGVRLAQVRWAMSRMLAAHLAKEDQLVYPRLRTSGDAAVAATARRFADELGGLAACWRSYMADWTVERIRADWPGFAGETTALMRALGRRIEKEEGELYPLLDRV